MPKVKIEKKAPKGENPSGIPNLFTEFAWFPLSLDIHYGYLAAKARQEFWGMPDNPFFILDSYFVNTYLHTMKYIHLITFL